MDDNTTGGNQTAGQGPGKNERDRYSNWEYNDASAAAGEGTQKGTAISGGDQTGRRKKKKGNNSYDGNVTEKEERERGMYVLHPK